MATVASAAPLRGQERRALVPPPRGQERRALVAPPRGQERRALEALAALAAAAPPAA